MFVKHFLCFWEESVWMRLVSWIRWREILKTWPSEFRLETNGFLEKQCEALLKIIPGNTYWWYIPCIYPACWGGRIHRLYLCRRVKTPTTMSVLDMTLKQPLKFQESGVSTTTRPRWFRRYEIYFVARPFYSSDWK